MFGYPKFNKRGEKILTRMDGRIKNMLMDISVFQLRKGEKRKFIQSDKEIAVLLVLGKVRFTAGEIDEIAERTSLFDDLPTCLHVCKATQITVEALEDTEILYQATANDKVFGEKLYRKKDIIRTTACEGMWRTRRCGTSTPFSTRTTRLTQIW
jgi:5-deoxy-glucuronate isomerase